MNHVIERIARAGTRRVRSASGAAYRSAGRRIAQRRLASLPQGAKLHLGSGGVNLDGWVNVDLDRRTDPDVVLDLRWGLPAPAGRARYIFSEHVIEHLELEDALRLLSDCRDVLSADGVLRIAMPDLRTIVERYEGDWRDQDWLRWPGHEYVDTPARMLNVSLREWGHRYLWDFEEVVHRLRALGYSEVERADWGDSAHPDLKGLETRADSMLVVEARP